MYSNIHMRWSKIISFQFILSMFPVFVLSLLSNCTYAGGPEDQEKLFFLHVLLGNASAHAQAVEVSDNPNNTNKGYNKYKFIDASNFKTSVGLLAEIEESTVIYTAHHHSADSLDTFSEPGNMYTNDSAMNLFDRVIEKLTLVLPKNHRFIRCSISIAGYDEYGTAIKKENYSDRMYKTLKIDKDNENIHFLGNDHLVLGNAANYFRRRCDNTTTTSHVGPKGQQQISIDSSCFMMVQATTCICTYKVTEDKVSKQLDFSSINIIKDKDGKLDLKTGGTYKMGISMPQFSEETFAILDSNKTWAEIIKSLYDMSRSYRAIVIAEEKEADKKAKEFAKIEYSTCNLWLILVSQAAYTSIKTEKPEKVSIDGYNENIVHLMRMLSHARQNVTGYLMLQALFGPYATSNLKLTYDNVELPSISHEDKTNTLIEIKKLVSNVDVEFFDIVTTQATREENLEIIIVMDIDRAILGYMDVFCDNDKFKKYFEASKDRPKNIQFLLGNEFIFYVLKAAMVMSNKFKGFKEFDATIKEFEAADEGVSN